MKNFSIAWILLFAFWQLIYEIIETSLSCTFLFQVTFDIFSCQKAALETLNRKIHPCITQDVFQIGPNGNCQ